MDGLCRITARLQNQKHKIQSNILKIKTSKKHHENNTGVVHQLTTTAIFVATPMKKANFTVHFIKWCFFCLFIDKKVVGLMPKYFLLAGDTSLVSIFPCIGQK